MSTDRELLELAAKAAGFTIVPLSKIEQGKQWLWSLDLGDYWNPLADDGDALRLAVKLGIDIDFELDDGLVHAWIQYEREPAASENISSDRFAATRRAIVIAAAEIGRALP